MKKTFVIMALLMLVSSSCSNMERKEKKLVEAMQSDDFETASQAFSDFCEWLKNDQSTMTYDFKLMREQFGMNQLTSKDGNLRFYSWITNDNPTAPLYANVVQWKSGEDFVGYSGPLNNMLNSHKKDASKNKEMTHSIDTIIDIKVNNQPVYLVVQSHMKSDGKKRSFISALTIQQVLLTRLPFFFDGTEVAGNLDYENNGNIKVGDLYKWDEKSNRLLVYQTDDNFHVIPNQYTVLQLENGRMNRVEPATEINQ